MRMQRIWSCIIGKRVYEISKRVETPHSSMAGNASHLSLLSRGVGELKQNGSERVDVILEPEVSVGFCTNDVINFGMTLTHFVFFLCLLFV